MLKTLLLELMEELERIGRRNSELYDTDIRENLFETVFNGFVKALPDFSMPDSFGLADEPADRAARLAVERYIQAAGAEAARQGLTSARSRLMAFQDATVQTRGDEQYTDDFFGWMDPDEVTE